MVFNCFNFQFKKEPKDTYDKRNIFLVRKVVTVKVTIFLNGLWIELVREFRYFRNMVSDDWKCEKEVKTHTLFKSLVFLVKFKITMQKDVVKQRTVPFSDVSVPRCSGFLMCATFCLSANL